MIFAKESWPQWDWTPNYFQWYKNSYQWTHHTMCQYCTSSQLARTPPFSPLLSIYHPFGNCNNRSPHHHFLKSHTDMLDMQSYIWWVDTEITPMRDFNSWPMPYLLMILPIEPSDHDFALHSQPTIYSSSIFLITLSFLFTQAVTFNQLPVDFHSFHLLKTCTSS